MLIDNLAFNRCNEDVNYGFCGDMEMHYELLDDFE